MSDTQTNSLPEWPTSSGGPSDNPDFQILFHGLFGIAYNQNTGICEVGAHAKAPDHQFKIFVIELEPDDITANLLFSFTPESHTNVGPIVVDVERPQVPGVSFFQSQTNAADEANWSLLPDLEGPLFHNVKLEKKTNSLRPRINIHHGLFSVAVTTGYRFNRVLEDVDADPVEIGELAYLPGAQFSHEPGGSVHLTIENQRLTLQAVDGRRYLICFLNICLPDDCHYDAHSPIKERRNDFYMYYKTFLKPENDPEYGLRLVEPQEASKRMRSKASFIIDLLAQFFPLSSKDSPCGAVGYGRSNGLD